MFKLWMFNIFALFDSTMLYTRFSSNKFWVLQVTAKSPGKNWKISAESHCYFRISLSFSHIIWRSKTQNRQSEMHESTQNVLWTVVVTICQKLYWTSCSIHCAFNFEILSRLCETMHLFAITFLFHLRKSFLSFDMLSVTITSSLSCFFMRSTISSENDWKTFWASAENL